MTSTASNPASAMCRNASRRVSRNHGAVENIRRGRGRAMGRFVTIGPFYGGTSTAQGRSGVVATSSRDGCGYPLAAVTETDNLPAWTGEPGRYEVWFLTCTDPVMGQGYWLRSTLTAPRGSPPYGAVWFARFDRADASGTFGIHHRYPIESVKVARGEF